MANQIVARQQGDDYQARWFWLQACGLLDDHSKVERVVYEDATLRAFDDVVVYYKSGYTDSTGVEINAHFYQIKFHVTSNGAITGESLCEPSFINASKFSLLERIKNAHDDCVNNKIKYRLTFYSPWSIHPDDCLARAHSQSDGGILWKRLSEGGDQSKLGRLRKCWRDHLGFQNDEELRLILANLSIQQGPTLAQLSENLNFRLRDRGLKPVPENSLIHTYDELTRKLLAANIKQLTAKSLRELCEREKLFMKSSDQDSNSIPLGIRSFIRWAEDLQNQTQAMICLSPFFEGRKIKNAESWSTDIIHELRYFINKNIFSGKSYRLYLDTHTSIGFLAGYLLPEKMGVTVNVVQRSHQGNTVWSFENDQASNDKLWDFKEEQSPHAAEEYALAIGLTHDISKDVIEYIRHNWPSVGFIVLANPKDGPSPSSVKDGPHANKLADNLLWYMHSNGIGRSEKSYVHIFSAAPNGFMFCLGRKMQSIRYWGLYEYDFDSSVIGAYSPSFINRNRI